MKGSPTRKVWYYQLDPGRNMGKTNALNDNDLKEFVALQACFAKTEKSWSVDVKGIDRIAFDLSVKNPNKAEDDVLRDPQDIIAEIAALDMELDFAHSGWARAGHSPRSRRVAGGLDDALDGGADWFRHVGVCGRRDDTLEPEVLAQARDRVGKGRGRFGIPGGPSW